MSAVGLTDAEAADAFAQFAVAKGDHLAEFMGVETNDDDPNTNTDGANGATPPDPSAAPAADTTGTQTTSQAQPAPAAAAPAAATKDIWANAPAEYREAHERALAQADQRYRSDIGRQAAHQRRIQVLEGELAEARKPKTAAAADGSAAPTTTTQPATTAPAAQPAKTGPASFRDSARIKEAREAYPEVIDPMLEAMGSLEQRLDAIQGDVNLTKEERAAATQEAQEAALNAAHPDWRKACATKEFADWLNAQPASMKAIVARNGENIVDAEEAIAMVGNYKAHLALTQPAPQPTQQQQQQQPARTATQPTNLQARRTAQLHAVTGAPAKGGQPAVITDGPAGGGEEAMFNHFAAKKFGNRK